MYMWPKLRFWTTKHPLSSFTGKKGDVSPNLLVYLTRMLIRQHFQNCNIALPRSTEFFIAPWKSYFPGLKNPIKVSFKMVMKIFEKQSIPRFLKMTQSQLYPSSLSSLFFPFILAFGKNACFHLCLSLIFSFCTISSCVTSVWTIMLNLYLLSTTSLSLHTQWWPYLTSAKSRYGCCPPCILPS